MKPLPRLVAPLVALLVLALLGPVPPVTAQGVPDPLRVLLVGDSISSGLAGDVTARYRLERMLDARGLGERVELVGRLTGTGAGSGPYRAAVEADPRFVERRHEAVQGRYTAEVADPGCLQPDGRSCWIGTMVAEAEPDLVLVNLGTNELISVVDGMAVLGLLETIVADARHAHTGGDPLQLAVAQPPPFDCELRSAYYRDYGDLCPRIEAGYADLAAGLVATFGSDPTVEVLELPERIDARADLHDALHPTASGEVALAEAWLGAILGVLGEQGRPPIPGAPSASAGPDLVVAPGAQVTLAGDGEAARAPLLSDWRQLLDPAEAGTVDRVAISGASELTASFTAPSTPQTLRFELQVSTFDAVARDTVTVVVREGGPDPDPDPEPDPGTVAVAPADDGGPVEVTVETTAGPVRVRLDGVTRGGTLTAVAATGDLPGVRPAGPVVQLRIDGIVHTAAQVCLDYEPGDVAPTIDHAQLVRAAGGEAIDLTVDRRGGERICGLAAGATALGEQPAVFAVGVLALQRIAGPDRMATAATLARRTTSPGADAVYVADAGDFPDALAAGPVAAADGAPVLLVPGVLDRATDEELQRLRPGRITVLGGPGAVPDAVVSDLQARTDGPVERLQGSSRYETAAVAARSAFTTAPTVYLASGQDFPDALSGGAAAAAAGAPLLLTGRDALHPAAAAALGDLDTERVVVLGGPGAVGEAVVDELEQLVPSVERRAGADRFATAAAVADTELAEADVAFVATGEEFADALAGVPAAARVGAPLLLVGRDVLPAPTATTLERLAPDRVVVLGGAGAVSDAVLRQLGGRGDG